MSEDEVFGELPSDLDEAFLALEVHFAHILVKSLAFSAENDDIQGYYDEYNMSVTAAGDTLVSGPKRVE